MKYYINYMNGRGPHEKTQIRRILDEIKSLPKIYLGNLDRLTDDIGKIQRFYPTLLPDEMEPKVKEIINEYESNIHKNENLNKIRSDLELILIKKASQITPQVIVNANSLKDNYIKINNESQEYIKLFNESRQIVDDILKVKGSQISDLDGFAEDFGDYGNGNTGVWEQNQHKEEDLIDFM